MTIMMCGIWVITTNTFTRLHRLFLAEPDSSVFIVSERTAWPFAKSYLRASRMINIVKFTNVYFNTMKTVASKIKNTRINTNKFIIFYISRLRDFNIMKKISKLK